MSHIKALLAVSLLLFPAILHAQDCNFDVDEKDKFTGEIVRKADQRLGSMTTHWNLILEQKGSKYFVGLKTLQNIAIQSPVSKGDQFLLRLEDGKVITITADKDYAPSLYAANGGVQTTITARGEVDREIMRQLSTSPVTDIKMTVGGNELTQSKIMSRQAKKVMAAAGCLATDK